MTKLTPDATGAAPVPPRRRARRRVLVAGVTGAAVLAVGTVAVLSRSSGEGTDAVARDRALAVVRAEKLSTWTPSNGTERRRSETWVGSVQGLPVRGVVQRDLVVPAGELRAAITEVVAAAEAAGWTREDVTGYTLREGTSWIAHLTKDSPCHCRAQLEAGAALSTSDPKGPFTGISINIVGSPAADDAGN